VGGLPYILGVSAFYHDAAAALVHGSEIVAAAQEERFSRKKNDEAFPREAIAFCLRQAGIEPADLSAVTFYDKPIVKFTRMIETYLAVAPAGWRTFGPILPTWFAEKLDLRSTIRRELIGLSSSCEILFTEHHQAHAASAFYPSPFHEAAILTVDGVGEWATTMIARGRGAEIEMLRELRFPHSLGLLYSAFTSYCGFRINSGEYKLMGLAPYGEPAYAAPILQYLVEAKPDGSFRLNLEYFDFLHGTTMTNERFHRLFGCPPRGPDEPITQQHCDIARSIQVVTEEMMLRLARHAREVTASTKLCLAGGVALNCVANGRIMREKIFDSIWIQPAAGDAGGALGAALATAHLHFQNQGSPHCGQQAHDTETTRPPASPKYHRRHARVHAAEDSEAESSLSDEMRGSFLGPEYSDEEILDALIQHDASWRRHDRDELLNETVALLRQEKVVAWFQGRMEFGPRALGNRSILGDPRSPRMQSVMNLKVKFRESFRPFAPAVLQERAAEYFELEGASPYMLLVAALRPELRRLIPPDIKGLQRLQHPHSTLPAVTHVDYSARVQTVSQESSPLFHELITRFDRETSCPVLINTSFNVRGEPIVCSPDDAYRCFMNSNIDVLVVGSYLLHRNAQPNRPVSRRVELQSD
jgi:carbamoyltransferase